MAVAVQGLHKGPFVLHSCSLYTVRYGLTTHLLSDTDYKHNIVIMPSPFEYYHSKRNFQFGHMFRED